MSRKTESHPHFMQSNGSILRTETGRDGSILCSPPTLINGTILYILEGRASETRPCRPANGPAEVVHFPLHRQVVKVRDTAAKLAKTKTARHATYYHEQVSKAQDRRLARKGLPPEERRHQISLFWQAVMLEIARCERSHA